MNRNKVSRCVCQFIISLLVCCWWFCGFRNGLDLKGKLTTDPSASPAWLFSCLLGWRAGPHRLSRTNYFVRLTAENTRNNFFLAGGKLIQLELHLSIEAPLGVAGL